MKSFAALIFLTLTVRAGSEDATPLPPAADLTIKNYEREVAAARDRAVRQLKSIMTAETKRGNLDSAIAIKNEITVLTSGGGATASTPTLPLKSENITIKANAKNGAEVGNVSAGMHIKLQYVEGRWAMSGGDAEDPSKWPSPDDEGIFAANRLGIFAVTDGDAKLLAEVSGGTKKKAFRFRFDKDYPMVMLRIKDGAPLDNPGFVIYNVEINK